MTGTPPALQQMTVGKPMSKNGEPVITWLSVGGLPSTFTNLISFTLIGQRWVCSSYQRESRDTWSLATSLVVEKGDTCYLIAILRDGTLCTTLHTGLSEPERLSLNVSGWDVGSLPIETDNVQECLWAGPVI